MAKTTIFIELEYPDDMLDHTIDVVTAENPELYAEGGHPSASNEELALNGWLAAMLHRLEAGAAHAETPILIHGADVRIEANNRVGERDFPVTARLVVSDGKGH